MNKNAFSFCSWRSTSNDRLPNSTSPTKMPAKTTQTISAIAEKICLNGENGLMKFSRSLKFLRSFCAKSRSAAGAKSAPCEMKFCSCARWPSSSQAAFIAAKFSVFAAKSASNSVPKLLSASLKSVCALKFSLREGFANFMPSSSAVKFS